MPYCTLKDSHCNMETNFDIFTYALKFNKSDLKIKK